jgi:hypothetical protein
MRITERIAQIVIEATCPGSRMQYISEQSHGEPDFNLNYADGARAVVEVTESVDRPWVEITEAIRGGRPIQATRCRFSWAVWPLANANLKDIHARVESLLMLLEAGGHRNSVRCIDAQVFEKMNELRISMAWVIEQTASSPTIQMIRPGQSGSVVAGVSQKVVEHEANKDDNKRKLSRFKCERHLYVHIQSRNLIPQRSIVDGSPPGDIPSIPAEITHVRAGALTDSGCGVVVWRAERGRPWQSMGVVRITPEQVREIFGV